MSDKRKFNQTWSSQWENGSHIIKPVEEKSKNKQINYKGLKMMQNDNPSSSEVETLSKANKTEYND